MIYGAPAGAQESNTITTAVMASRFATEDSDVRITTTARRSTPIATVGANGAAIRRASVVPNVLIGDDFERRHSTLGELGGQFAAAGRCSG
jgi:hypothetical protein